MSGRNCNMCRRDACPCLDNWAGEWRPEPTERVDDRLATALATLAATGISAADLVPPPVPVTTPFADRRYLARAITAAFDVPWDAVAPDELLTADELAARQARRAAYARSLHGRLRAARATVHDLVRAVGEALIAWADR